MLKKSIKTFFSGMGEISAAALTAISALILIAVFSAAICLFSFM